MALFVDGRGYAGNVEEIVLPKLTMKTEEFRNGGMDAPIEIELGMEKLESEFTLTRFDPDILKLFGLSTGQVVPMTLRGAVQSDTGESTAVVVNLQGMVREVDPGTWKPGDKATLKLMIAIRYYKLTYADDVLHEIDIPNMVRTIGGVDQLAATRTALGI